MKELDRRLRVMDQVIRHMVVRVDEEKKVVDRTRTKRQSESERRRVKRGLPPVRWPVPWPNDGLRVMRAAVFGGVPFARAAFRVHFVSGVPLSDASAIFLAADRAGLDPARVLAATEEQAVKDALRANTDRALGSGVSGVPTVVVGGNTFWGDAELEAATA